MYTYLVTTNKKDLPPGKPIAMIDGTVPGWQKEVGDLHFDHHRPGGHKVQLTEIPDETRLDSNCVFVTTRVDADACAAAAWLQLLQMDTAERCENRTLLVAIAYDCDHLGLPAESQWDSYREFAAKAVAALELRLPPNHKEWDENQRIRYESEAFQRGTEWLLDACLGKRDFPGANGEAAEYFAKRETQRPKVYENCYLYRGCAIFDQRSFNEYVDPRILVEWARENSATEPVTLTIRDGSRQPNTIPDCKDLFCYTLGSVPLHVKGSPEFSNRGVWQILQALEVALRADKQIHPPETAWGGRNEVGGSPWRDPAIALPEQVIDAVLSC